MLAPERCFEVAPDEFDGPVEAFVGRDFGRRSFEGLRMAGRIRKKSTRHVVPFGVGCLCACPVVLVAGF